METRTLDNGLRICYLPKEGFQQNLRHLAANFGSVDASFTCEGRRYDTPAGVAALLEHKMFEDRDGNALQNSRARARAQRLHQPDHDRLSFFLHRPV